MNAYSANSSSFKTNYPQGLFPIHVKRGEVIKPCLHCGNKFGLKRWDSWNGFLVECPYCHGLHGKRWSIKNILWASFFFNAVSFLFTMRLRNGILLLLAFVGMAVGGNYLLDHYQISDMTAVAGASLFILAPMIINAFVLIRHERDMERSTPSKADLLQVAHQASKAA